MDASQLVSDIRLNVLLFRESNGEKEMWVAQCLEHDIAAQAEELKEATKRFEKALLSHIALALKNILKYPERIPRGEALFRVA